jgi:hypothetical protein
MDSTAAVAKDLYRQTRRGSSSKSSRRVNVQEGSKGSAAARRAKLERFTKVCAAPGAGARQLRRAKAARTGLVRDASALPHSSRSACSMRHANSRATQPF